MFTELFLRTGSRKSGYVAPMLEQLESRIMLSNIINGIDIREGALSSSPRQFVAGATARLTLSRTTKTGQRFIAASNGGGVLFLAQLPMNSNPQNLFYFNGNLYFVATEPNTGGELWICSTIVANTTQVLVDINPGPANSGPTNFVL